MNVAIIGYATEGKVSADYFSSAGHKVTICDRDTSLVIPEGYSSKLGDNYTEALDSFDLIVRSAGIHPDVILRHNPGVAGKITTAINEFLSKSPSRNVIGITGTKGKGTTSSLTAAILEASGRKVWLGGNIGKSPLEFIDEVQPEDWIVLELSSFQLYDVKRSPHIAACLMVVPEHLDWHKDVEDYYGAKARLFENQTRDDVAVYFAKNETSQKIASTSTGITIPYYAAPGARVCEHGNIEIEESEKICKTDELQLLGKHNWENVCAAITVAWQAGCRDVAKIKQAVTSFTGLPHRLEFVRELNGVRYYNDSYAATPDAAIAALDAIPGKKVMIVGGYDRNLPIEHFAHALKLHESDTKVIVIGASAGRFVAACDKEGLRPMSTQARTMREIVRLASEAAANEASVVLSPGFASFDMFKNFEDRGNQFKQQVNAL